MDTKVPANTNKKTLNVAFNISKSITVNARIAVVIQTFF